MKVKCYNNISCQVCNAKGTLQVFFNSKGIPKYARIRHYSEGKFYYHQQQIQSILEILNENSLNIDQDSIDQKGNIDQNLPEKSLKLQNKDSNPLALSVIYRFSEKVFGASKI